MDARFTLLEIKFVLQMDALQNKLSLVMAGLVKLLVTAQRFFPPGQISYSLRFCA